MKPAIRSPKLPARRSKHRVLITGVNPFEDLPGYHFYSMLAHDDRYAVEVADDSPPALVLIESVGTTAHSLTHPGVSQSSFLDEVRQLRARHDFDFIIPGADAHLFALSQSEEFSRACPTSAWLRTHHIGDKWDAQVWVSSFAATPTRFRSVDEYLAHSIAQTPGVMVKGLIKGAAYCESDDCIRPAIRHVLRNPANQGRGEGFYLEESLEGEEYCALILKTGESSFFSLGLKKLATTESGTTLAAQIDSAFLQFLDLPRIADKLVPGMAIELEARKKPGGDYTIFEVNFRLPSWISALGDLGPRLLASNIDILTQGEDLANVAGPCEGQIIYRLPQSGFLSPSETFERPTNRTGSELLWPWASPHQFRVK